jgi:quinoprotein glucose dehydrogenase
MPETTSPSSGLRDWRVWFRVFTAVLLTVAGLGMAIPGGWLLILGGSAYYLVVGLGLVAVAVLLLRRSRMGLWLFGLLLLASIAWSLWEVGFDGWGLMPRLVFFAVVGLWLLIPALWRGASLPGPRARQATAIAFSAACLAILVAGVLALWIPSHSVKGALAGSAPPAATTDGQWTHYGANLGGTRYSALSQINPDTVGGLERAWVYRSGLTIPGGRRRGGLQVTPLMVDGVVYGCTAFNSIFALDPTTGRQLWRHDPTIEKDRGGHAVCRGIAFFRAPAGAPDCPTRLLVGTVANRLIALDAKTGKACPSFGTGGAVDLREGIGKFPQRWSHPTSPPTIVNGVAVIGAYVVDNQSTNVPPGVIRGYDAVTGQLKWAFDPARPDQTAPLAVGSLYTPATPNSWSVASGDEALGLVYVPMGNGAPDFVGGHRTPETNRFSSAVLALDARTGALRWSFQAIRHDLWDYDLAAQPVLTDFPTEAEPVPALILPTKTGQLFVLDRRTGKPLTRVEDRAVPASDVPGERASPTQPFSTGMPDMAGAALTERDMWGITPFDQLYCRIQFRRARYEGPFTPPRLGLSIRYPGELGGIDWGSVSVDQGRGVLVVNSNHMADLDELITRAQAEREGLVPRLDAKSHSAPGGPMAGTPYAVHWGAFMSGLEVPCQRPPYGFLTAIDLKTRKVVWRRPIGDARNSGPFKIGMRLPIPLGAPNIGGSLTTGGGLVFIAATQDEMFRAVDVRTGRVVWQEQLPASGHASGQSLRDKAGDYFVAYRLKAP